MVIASTPTGGGSFFYDKCIEETQSPNFSCDIKWDNAEQNINIGAIQKEIKRVLKADVVRETEARAFSDHQSDAMAFAREIAKEYDYPGTLTGRFDGSVPTVSAKPKSDWSQEYDSPNNACLNTAKPVVNPSFNTDSDWSKGTSWKTPVTTKAKLPNFRQYTSRWPLGADGYFYNSMGKHNPIKDMKTKYIKSTMSWLDTNFKFADHKFAMSKFEELSTELNKRNGNLPKDAAKAKDLFKSSVIAKAYSYDNGFMDDADADEDDRWYK